ncbi:SH3 domain-containing protein [Roseovarius sp. EL26]|uniref:SH3 domain-containing protein n=1 Tax=Roseovarius sp. EL26 TaxID=2126672 RepID=UPI000EA21768|nr:SH3 domain-containing protein [Roseovarius sp. EL26]
MHTTTFVTLAALFLGAILHVAPAQAASLGQHEVYGVEDDDMLKMRGGPGTGYSVIVGLPNGTVLRVHSCERTGSTRWCHVSLDRARGLKGYVSWAYLRKM